MHVQVQLEHYTVVGHGPDYDVVIMFADAMRHTVHQYKLCPLLTYAVEYLDFDLLAVNQVFVELVFLHDGVSRFLELAATDSHGLGLTAYVCQVEPLAEVLVGAAFGKVNLVEVDV